MPTIKPAAFTSVWDGGYEITTPCSVNIQTKKVFDIEVVPFNGDHLDREYVTIDGKEYPVKRSDDLTPLDDTFWYE